MACNIQILSNNVFSNSIIDSNSLGTIFFLGYSATQNVTPCDLSGLVDSEPDGDIDNADVTAYIIANVATWGYSAVPGPTPANSVPYTVGYEHSSNPVVDVTGWTPGFYGWLFVTGNLEGCFDYTCSEFEVIDGVDDMMGSDLGQFCESDLTISSPGLDLVEGVTNYQAGGVWSQTGNPSTLVITDPTDVEVPVNSNLGVYTFTYTIDESNLTATYPIDDCDNCSTTVDVTFEIISAPDAGTPSPIAVCN